MERERRNKTRRRTSNREREKINIMFRKQHSVIRIINGVVVDLPTPANISVMWNWGSLLGLTLVIQLVSGILLATRFSALSEYSFERVVVIFQESNYG